MTQSPNPQAGERGDLAEAIAHLRQRADQAEDMASKEEDWHAAMPGDVRAEMKREASNIRTVLAALATQEQEPVAWRWRNRPDGVWNYQEARQRINSAEHQPLFARPVQESREEASNG